MIDRCTAILRLRLLLKSNRRLPLIVEGDLFRRRRRLLQLSTACDRLRLHQRREIRQRRAVRREGVLRSELSAVRSLSLHRGRRVCRARRAHREGEGKGRSGSAVGRGDSEAALILLRDVERERVCATLLQRESLRGHLLIASSALLLLLLVLLLLLQGRLSLAQRQTEAVDLRVVDAQPPFPAAVAVELVE